MAGSSKSPKGRDHSPGSTFPSAECSDYGESGDERRFFPSLTLVEWLVFALLAALLAAANIYTTLLIGWGDTGSIIAVLASAAVLRSLGNRPSVQVLNLGQTMASAGGSIGFATASYAAVYLIRPDFRPSPFELTLLFFAMGLVGTLIGSSVRQYMVQYFFPSGTACAVIQVSVAKGAKTGERNRPLDLLKRWGSVAALLTIPTKITLIPGGAPLFADLIFSASRGIGLGVDPLYYGIGIVIGPRVGLGMLLGAISVPFLISDRLAGTSLAAESGDWVKWIAIAILTIPTFATIVFAYWFRAAPSIPEGFHPGQRTYASPSAVGGMYALIFAIASVVVAIGAQRVFGLSWPVCLLTIAIAWPLCVVNGRVTGDTDINPVRLVAVVLLSGFFWLFRADGGTVIAMLGMAVVGGTLASVAVDMMQDFRTGYLVNANPTHQTSVQLLGTLFGAIAAVPVLSVLLGQLGIGEGSSLPAPGAQVWAAMANAMAGGFHPSSSLIQAIVLTSVVGSLYAFLTVWPTTANYMPSIFGIGIGMLVGVPASGAILVGGIIKWGVTMCYQRAKIGDVRETAIHEAANDTMLVGASVFAAAAVVSILLVLLTTLLEGIGVGWFFIAH